MTLHLVVKNVQFDMQHELSAITQVTTQPMGRARVHRGRGAGRSSLRGTAQTPARTPQAIVRIRVPAAASTCRASSLRRWPASTWCTCRTKAAAGGQDLVGGQVPVAVLGSTPLIPHHKAGRIRIIAFTSQGALPADARDPDAARVRPSQASIPRQWLGILAPKGTSAESGRPGLRRDAQGTRARGCEGKARAGRAAAGRQLAERVRGADPRGSGALDRSCQGN